VDIQLFNRNVNFKKKTKNQPPPQKTTKNKPTEMSACADRRGKPGARGLSENPELRRLGWHKSSSGNW
jgi:hypothetical protein